MTFIRRRATWIAACAGLLLLAASPFFFGTGQSRLEPPPLSPAATEQLARIDIDLGFHAAKLNRQPQDGGHVEKLARQWIRRGKLTADGADFASALKLLDAGERSIQGDPRLPAARIEVLLAHHRFVEARTAALQAAARFPQDDRLAAMAAEAAMNAGDLAAGEAGFRASLALNSRSAAPYVGLARCAELAGDLESAEQYLLQSLSAGYPRPLSRDSFAYVRSTLGVIYSKQGRLDDATHQYKWALAKSPGYAAAVTGLADIAQWNGQDAEAETLLRGLVAREVPNHEYQLKLAQLRERLGDAAEAQGLRDEAERFLAWSVSTGYEGYLRPLATLRLEQGRHQEAAELALRDLELRPDLESRRIYANVIASARAAGRRLHSREPRLPAWTLTQTAALNPDRP